MRIESDSAGVKIPPPFLFLGTLLVGWGIQWVAGSPGIPLLSDYIEHALGWIAVVAGAAITLSALGLFKRAGTSPEPWKTTTSFVTDGVYRWTRNPMYLGMATIYLGIALLLDSLVVALLLIPVLFIITREVIEREEAYMEAKFGDEYRAYKARAKRWF